jgi:hypothetical protein
MIGLPRLAVWVVDRRKIKSFRPLKRSGAFLLLVHCAAGAARTAKPARRAEGRMPGVKKDHQRESARRSAHVTSTCRGSAQGDGSFRRHILVPTKRWPTSCRPPFGLIRQPAPLRRGPVEERALLRARTRATATTTSEAPSPAERSESFARKRMDALPVKGPLRSGGRWRSTRRAVCRMHAVFRRCMDAPPKNSVTARGPGAQDVRKALRRGVLPFGYSFVTPGILLCALRAGFAVRAAPAAQWTSNEK